MEFLVLGNNLERDCPAYRGTYRSSPYFLDDLSEDHPANQAFLVYVHAGSTLRTVDDLTIAQRLVAEYSRLDPPQHFEVVALLRGRISDTDDTFLGYDLSSGFHLSLLSRGLNIPANQKVWTENDSLRVLLPLARLVGSYFRPKLNANLLFDTYEDASFCLECMMALQKLHPNLWEGDEAVFDVVALERVMNS